MLPETKIKQKGDACCWSISFILYIMAGFPEAFCVLWNSAQSPSGQLGPCRPTGTPRAGSPVAWGSAGGSTLQGITVTGSFIRSALGQLTLVKGAHVVLHVILDF